MLHWNLSKCFLRRQMDFINIQNNQSCIVGAFGHRVLDTRGKELYTYGKCYGLLMTLKNRFER
jgi:hypothetical protein